MAERDPEWVDGKVDPMFVPLKKSFWMLFPAAIFGGAVALFAQGAFQTSRLPYSHRQLEEYEMSVGLTGQGSPDKQRPVVDEREVLRLPDYYGTLLAVHPSGSSSVFWYQDGQGVLRNAVVDRVAERAVAIEIAPTRKLKITTQRESPR